MSTDITTTNALPTQKDRTTAQVRALGQSYTERVNMAIADDRYDLVGELAASYEQELKAIQAA